jgi:hypothetical protein
MQKMTVITFCSAYSSRCRAQPGESMNGSACRDAARSLSIRSRPCDREWRDLVIEGPRDDARRDAIHLRHGMPQFTWLSAYR